MTYPTREDVYNKLDWEGGLDGFLQYGFEPEDINENDTELIVAAERMMAAWSYFEAAGDEFLRLLEQDCCE